MRSPLGDRRGPVATVPFPGEPRRAATARIAPADRAELGRINALICRAIGAATGGEPPHVFTTLGRHRRLFRAWLRFARRLMPFGTLPRRDAELVILRVAVNCGSDYEWRQHATIGQRAGLSAEDVTRVGEGPEAAGWSPRQYAILSATDELCAVQVVSQETWQELGEHLDERGLIELCMLAGHYTMLAGTLNSLGVEPEGG